MGLHIKGGMTVVIEAGMQLTLKVGGNFVDISPMGVCIQGSAREHQQRRRARLRQRRQPRPARRTQGFRFGEQVVRLKALSGGVKAESRFSAGETIHR